jgi:large subunit ribosomal protein L29
MAKKDKKVVDLTGRTADQLNQDLLDLKKQQFNMRFQLSQGQLSNTAQVRENRRQIARVRTAMGKSASAAADQSAPKAKLVKAQKPKKAAGVGE